VGKCYITNNGSSLSFPNFFINFQQYKAEAVNTGGLESSEAIVTMAKVMPKFLKSLPRRESFSEGEPILLKVPPY